ncbi:MAG: sulfatase-like hydrolase/transferase [Solirubrobacterales bacterium]
MNFIVVCLHCLDMRDFHSHLRDTPFLDRLRHESILIPTGRAQGHNQDDSLNAELTGIWTARFCDSSLTEEGFRSAKHHWLPKTLIETLHDAGFDVVTRIAQGTHAVGGGMREQWLRDEPERLAQFTSPRPMDLDEWLAELRRSRRFYAHVVLRQTHRPWADVAGLFALLGEKPPEQGEGYPRDAACARRAALQYPDAFAALRRRGLAEASRTVERIFDATRDLDDVTYLVYSNHGEVFDHFRYHLPYPDDGDGMIRGTSHGPYPYEVLYANMQVWVIPGHSPRVMHGVGRSIDIAPTILDLAGVDRSGLDGESMLGHFGSGRFPDRDRYAENPRGGCVSMVRSDGWKLISTGRAKDADPPRLATDYHRLAVFDLRSDPDEYVNLADTPQGKEVLGWALERHRELGRNRVPTASSV